MTETKPVKPRGPGAPQAKGASYQKPSLKAAEKVPKGAEPDPEPPKAKPKAKKEAPPAEE